MIDDEDAGYDKLLDAAIAVASADPGLGLLGAPALPPRLRLRLAPRPAHPHRAPALGPRGSLSGGRAVRPTHPLARALETRRADHVWQVRLLPSRLTSAYQAQPTGEVS